jgi:hypothetical protein
MVSERGNVSTLLTKLSTTALLATNPARALPCHNRLPRSRLMARFGSPWSNFRIARPETITDVESEAVMTELAEISGC